MKKMFGISVIQNLIAFLAFTCNFAYGIRIHSLKLPVRLYIGRSMILKYAISGYVSLRRLLEF